MPLKYETFTETIKSTAIRTSGTGPKYRIKLTRVWDESKPIVVFLCMNPSYADELNTDATVSTCGNLAASWRAYVGGYTILNLYSHYATDPKDCEKSGEAAEENAEYIASEIEAAHIVVVCCGNDQKRRLRKVFSLMSKESQSKLVNRLYCLKKNNGGGFLHPRNVTLNDVQNGIFQFTELVELDLHQDILK